MNIVKMFESLSIYEFQAQFKDDKSCTDLLVSLKWEDGYSCRYCGYTNYCATKRYGERRCCSCKRPESATAHTLFHKLKFSIHKAFMMLYLISSTKKGISALELHRKMGLHKRTCLFFKRKVMTAMSSHSIYKMDGQVEVDQTYIGGKEKTKVGRSKGRKKLLAIGIERSGKGIYKAYPNQITNAGVKRIKTIF